MAAFKGKVFAVTGAASGIGLATVCLLYSRGASLAISDIQGDAVQQVADSIHPSRISDDQEVVASTVDVTKSDEVNSWIQDVLRRFGRLDGAANIAGVETHGIPFSETTDESWEFVMGVNATGVFKCLRAELPHIQSGGAVVNVASIVALMGVPEMVSYSASKHAVVGITKSAAKEYGSKGIRVNAVAPGLVATPMLQNMRASGMTLPNSHLPLSRDADPKEIATVIAFLLGEDSSYMTGHVALIDGGYLS
ncbi:hypothetical protein AYL99_03955 [Fonsecaea erecta]|uniref:Uncharacterized protein n=1 Tax=Fonsecaea erecta TaxID=1367422 RepID=A0A178ZQ31_9EURO|nr:hypothetical protein AYL99_03955 [Fonsecaea erecta]OAP61752.1 hypothetical protein AYL99_03955 [Fonsecaea erecta]